MGKRVAVILVQELSSECFLMYIYNSKHAPVFLSFQQHLHLGLQNFFLYLLSLKETVAALRNVSLPSSDTFG